MTSRSRNRSLSKSSSKKKKSNNIETDEKNIVKLCDNISIMMNHKYHENCQVGYTKISYANVTRYFLVISFISSDPDDFPLIEYHLLTDELINQPLFTARFTVQMIEHRDAYDAESPFCLSMEQEEKDEIYISGIRQRPQCKLRNLDEIFLTAFLLIDSIGGIKKVSIVDAAKKDGISVSLWRMRQYPAKLTLISKYQDYGFQPKYSDIIFRLLFMRFPLAISPDAVLKFLTTYFMNYIFLENYNYKANLKILLDKYSIQ